MTRLESQVEQQLCARLHDELGLTTIKLERAKGYPDRLVLTPLHPVFVEVKRPGEEPERIQAARHGFLRRLGYTVLVVDNVEEGMAWFKEVMG